MENWTIFGETIAPGTNCTITTIADALNALAAQ